MKKTSAKKATTTKKTSAKKTTATKKSTTRSKRQPSKSLPRSSSRKASAKKATGSKSTRNYYTVSEDWQIIEFIKRNTELKATATAQILGQKLGRNKESIRDRVKRYLSKIPDKDHSKIRTAAKVSAAC